jgi:hypothetical protein
MWYKGERSFGFFVREKWRKFGNRKKRGWLAFGRKEKKGKSVLPNTPNINVFID